MLAPRTPATEGLSDPFIAVNYRTHDEKNVCRHDNFMTGSLAFHIACVRMWVDPSDARLALPNVELVW